MYEIVATRQNGFLNLNEYFNKVLKENSYYHDIQTLYEKGIIEIEVIGISDKFWILDYKTGDKIALYKQQNGTYMCYAELFAEEIAKILGFENAHYDLATLNGYEGVISYNFLKDDEEYLTGYDITSEYYENFILEDEELAKMYNIDLENDTIGEIIDKLNNLDSIWSILEEKYKNDFYKREIIFNIMDKAVDKLMFDILTVNVDDHGDNWGLVGDRLAPLFDNERILNMHRKDRKEEEEEKKDLNDKELLLTVDSEGINKPLEVLKYFLDISSYEYTERFKEKLNKLETNIEYVPLNVEKTIHKEIPSDIKEYFLNTMYDHIDNIHRVLSVIDKGSKK